MPPPKAKAAASIDPEPEKAPIDPEAVLTSMRSLITRMDHVMDKASDDVDRAAVNMAVSMGASHEQVQSLLNRQAEQRMRKQVARDGGTVATSMIATAQGCGGLLSIIQEEKEEDNDDDEDAPAAEATTRLQKTKTKKKKKRGWQAPQDVATRGKALRDGAPAPPPELEALERCWDCFPALPPAGASDWLGNGGPGERDRAGQPLKRFLQPGPHRSFPTRSRPKIYLLPLGNAADAPPPATLCRLLELWFLLEVVPMAPPKAADVAALERDPAGSGYGPQIESPSAFELLHARKPRDAYILLAYTMEDLCDTRKGFDFLFGQANLDLGVGLFSFARYSDDVAPTSPRFLRRCGMVLCHEASHLVGIKHCVYASCVMNGSNHLEESEDRPFALCPVDLRKLQLTLDAAKLQGRETPPTDLAARERGLAAFFDEHGLPDDARRSRAIVAALTGQPVVL